MLRHIILIIFLLLNVIFSYYSSVYAGLKIGILRHLTIEQADQLGIDSQAEKMLFTIAFVRGHHIEFINPLQIIYDIAVIPDYDVIISRAEIDNFANNITDAYLRALDYFETVGIPVINAASATLNAQDKFRTLLLAQQAGIRLPYTFLVHNYQDVQKLLATQKVNFPFFIKKPYSGCGKGVFLIEGNQKLEYIITHYFQHPEPILVEERIDLETNQDGNVKDMRVWVVRDAVTQRARFVGGAYRTAAPGNYLTNTSAGGTLSELPYDENIVAIAQKALDVVGADVAGIDLARDKEGKIYLLEVNISFYTGAIFNEIIKDNIWEYVMDLAETRIVQRGSIS